MIYIYIICFLISIPLLTILVGYILSTRPYKGPITQHFNGKRFQNPSRRKANSFKEVGQYIQKREPDKWAFQNDAFIRKELPPVPNEEQVQFIFINHSTFLIQHKGLNILTDPIWSKRCSPFQFIGPQRMRPPGLDFDALPKIDVVLISHNHYDHMDKNTIKRLNKVHQPTYICPLGNDKILKSWGCKNIVCKDWWSVTEIADLQFHIIPANHFSSRGFYDRNTSQWCGFYIQSNQRRIYYVGDTGYGDNFEEVKSRIGSPDLSFIPIGAFKPEWFMGPIHVTPEEAIQIHLDVESTKSIAMHFGTFPLADDNPKRAKERLLKGLKKAQLNESDFEIVEEGKVHVY